MFVGKMLRHPLGHSKIDQFFIFRLFLITFSFLTKQKHKKVSSFRKFQQFFSATLSKFFDFFEWQRTLFSRRRVASPPNLMNRLVSFDSKSQNQIRSEVLNGREREIKSPARFSFFLSIGRISEAIKYLTSFLWYRTCPVGFYTEKNVNILLVSFVLISSEWFGTFVFQFDQSK